VADPVQTLLIDGQWRGGQRNMAVSNPYSGAHLQDVSCASAEDVAAVLASARGGLERNRLLSTRRRAQILHDVAALVAQRRDSFAQCITSESGKPIAAARKEVDRCVNTLTLAAEEATRIVGETINFDSYGGGEQRSGYYFYEPIGIVVAITPFNDPLNLVAHKLGPAVAAGNAVILKPSEQAPLSALRLVEVFLECGLPAGVVNVLTGYGRDFGQQLVGSPEVAMVSFTGGERAGEAIAQSAGIKKLAMELGANSPVIVSGQSQLGQAVDACVSGAFWASGQNCIGVQRIFVHQSCYRSFAQQFVSEVEQLQAGDPALEGTDVGPMISEADISRVHAWVTRAKAQGARVLCGGVELGHGCYAPTVLDVGEHTIAVTDEEVFGPVVSLHSYSELPDAVREANRPEYMIHGAIFTDNLQEAMYASKALDCAGVLVNDSTDYRLDAMPFGGAKRGAMGREGVKFAIREMVQTKTVCMNLAN
jgi:acyl-CoA reductase-like NAD-dependent aldehyde dehydrogenase